MNNNLDVKPEIIFKNLNSVLSKSITINVDLKKRNMSLYLHEYSSCDPIKKEEAKGTAHVDNYSNCLYRRVKRSRNTLKEHRGYIS